MNDDLIARMRVTGAVRFGAFKLRSGAASDHYFDVKRLLLDSAGLDAVSGIIGQQLRTEYPTVAAVGGVELGPVPLLGSLLCRMRLMAALSGGDPADVPAGFVVRKPGHEKDHGLAARTIEGPVDDLPHGAAVALVEDVVTTGGSVLGGVDAAEARGWRVRAVFAVLDREAGARAVFAARGIDFRPLMTASRVLAAVRPK